MRQKTQNANAGAQITTLLGYRGSSGDLALASPFTRTVIQDPHSPEYTRRRLTGPGTSGVRNPPAVQRGETAKQGPNLGNGLERDRGEAQGGKRIQGHSEAWGQGREHRGRSLGS